jgi:transmembrane sensor
MGEMPKKVERALEALHEEGWTDLQHRRVAKRLEEALDSPSRPVSPWVLGLAAAAACAGLVALGARWRAQAPVAAATTGASAAPEPRVPALLDDSSIGNETEEAKAVLGDGSAVEVARGGRVRLVHDRADETRLELVRGRAEFEVQKRPERPFIASVRGVEVRVIGTHFSTELDTSRTPSIVRVVVQRGVVEIRGGASTSPVRVAAGESLEVPIEMTPPATAETTQPAAPPAPLTAAQLFEAANAARGAGDVDGATRSYAALLKQYPGDERAGIAALELGRLRMDSQHAYRRAAEAFHRAIAAAPNEGVREDAMARLVEALDATHDRTACDQERQRYLARYPKGVHAAQVEARCR